MGVTPTRCPRCRSLVVQEIFVDYGSSTPAMSFPGYRCLVCGDIGDATMLQHRAAQPFSGSRKPYRRRHLPLIGRTSYYT